MSPLDSCEPSHCTTAAGNPPSISLSSVYIHPLTIQSLSFCMQRAADRVEAADVQGSGPGQGQVLGQLPGGIQASNGDSVIASLSEAAVGEVMAVRDQVTRLVAEINNGNSKVENEDKTYGDNEIDEDDGVAVSDGSHRQNLGEYHRCSDQALVEYATSTALSLLDATLRRCNISSIHLSLLVCLTDFCFDALTRMIPYVLFTQADKK